MEVKKTGYDKGVAALKFVSEREFDFVIAFGDDRTDEDIFQPAAPGSCYRKNRHYAFESEI